MKSRNPRFVLQHTTLQDQTRKAKLALHFPPLTAGGPQGLAPTVRKRLRSLFLPHPHSCPLTGCQVRLVNRLSSAAEMLYFSHNL